MPKRCFQQNRGRDSKFVALRKGNWPIGLDAVGFWYMSCMTWRSSQHATPCTFLSLLVVALVLVACPQAQISTTPPLRTRLPRIPTGMRLAKPDGHLAEVDCLSFSPDGRLLVSGSGDSTLLVWDVSSGNIVQRLEGHHGFVAACAFHPDGRHIVSGGWGGDLFVWDRMTGAKRVLAKLPEAYSIRRLRVRPDGREVLVGTEYGHVASFDFVTGQNNWAKDDLVAPGSWVTALGWLDTGEPFAASDQGRVLTWKDEGPQLLQYSAASAEPLSGGRLVLGGHDEAVLAYPDGHIERLGPQTKWANGVSVGPRGDMALVGDASGLARLWDIASKSARCEMHADGTIQATAVDPTGTWLAVAGVDGSILLAPTAACIDGRHLNPDRRFATSRMRASTVASGPELLVGGIGGITSWALPDAARVESWSLPGAGEIGALAALKGGGWIAGGQDYQLWMAPAYLGGEAQAVGYLRNKAVAIQPTMDGGFLTADLSGDVARARKGPPSVLLQANESLSALAIRPGEGQAVVAAGNDRLRVLDLHSESAYADWPTELPPSDSVSAAEYTRDGALLVEGGTHGQLLTRDADSGAIRARLEGLHGVVGSLAMTDDQIWAGGIEGTLARWRLPIDARAKPLLIPEGAGIFDLAVSGDGQFLADALGDGRVLVRNLPSGELLATLIPLRDGSWASIFADGSFKTSGAGASLELTFEDPSTRKVARLGQQLQLAFGTATSTRTDEGSAAVRATLYSPQGPPHVVLDGAIPVRGVLPSASIVSAYEVNILLDDPSSRPHRLEAIDPNGAKSSVEVRSQPFLRNTTLQPRALLIGNSEYAFVRKLKGVQADENAMGEALRASDAWALSGDRLETKHDLGKAELAPTVEAFFQSALEGETLLFYFAGHGHTEGNDGFLLPQDYRPGTSMRESGALSSSVLWKAARNSRAAQIVIILDACRAGAFSLPETLGDDLDRDARIGLVLAASAGSDSYETDKGGLFTQAFAKALRDPERLDVERKAVTLGRAYNYAAGLVYDQGPRLKGGLDTLPLAWPIASGQRPSSVSQSAQTAGERVTWHLLTSRQVDPSWQQVSGTLVVDVTFGDPADALSIGVYDPAVTPPVAHPEKAWTPPDVPPGGWKPGQPGHFKVPLNDLTPGDYLVEVLACFHGKCDPSRFKFTLKPANQ